MGDLVRRGPIPGATQFARLFKLTLVTDKVFSADSADGQWSHWGGPIGRLHDHGTLVPASTTGSEQQCGRGPCYLGNGHEGECEPGPSIRPAGSEQP